MGLDKNAQLTALSQVVGASVPSTAGRDWFSTLCALLDRAPHAAIVVDMKVPMLPIAHANEAFASLTGYSVAEAVGRNCRFLQGGPTEPSALSAMISAIRSQQSCRVRITNVRRDGQPFVNDLSLHPVFDSKGVYRYSIGVLADGASGAATHTLQLHTRS